MKKVSIYHRYEISEEIPLTKENVESWNKDLDGGFGKLGEAILYSLYKYKVLNRRNIEKCVSIKSRNSWKTKNVRKSLLMLRKAGLIKAIGFKEKREEDNVYRLILYYLTMEGIKELTRIKPNAKQKMIDESNIDEMLRTASINQWHISMLYSYGRSITESIYNNFSIKNGEIVPSVTQVEKNGEKITIFAYPAPRREEEIKPFLLQILKLEQFLLTAKQYRPSIVLAVTESPKMCSWLSWNINKYRETRPLYVLYSMDHITQLEEPLRYLQICSADEMGMTRINIDFM